MVLDLDLTGQGTSISRGVLRKGFKDGVKGKEEGMGEMCVCPSFSLSLWSSSAPYSMSKALCYFTPHSRHQWAIACAIDQVSTDWPQDTTGFSVCWWLVW